ncbi:hypothetical protein V8E36_000854 [Tilletia maclaganii]
MFGDEHLDDGDMEAEAKAASDLPGQAEFCFPRSHGTTTDAGCLLKRLEAIWLGINGYGDATQHIVALGGPANLYARRVVLGHESPSMAISRGREPTQGTGATTFTSGIHPAAVSRAYMAAEGVGSVSELVDWVFKHIFDETHAPSPTTATP